MAEISAKKSMTESLFTQFAALLAAALLIPSFIFLAYGVNHRNMPFWWTAAIAYFLIFFGSTLAAARNILPDLAVSFLANALIAVGYVLCLRSVRMVKTCWRFSQADLVLFGAYLASLVLVVTLNNTYPARVALISTFIAVISSTAFMAVFRCAVRTSRLGDVALLVFGFGNAMFATFRGGSAVLGRTDYFLSFALWDQVFFIWSIAAVFCFAIGLFLNGTALIGDETRRALEKERLLTEALTEALEGQRNLQKLVLHELKRPLNSVVTAVELSRHGQAGMSPEEVERVHQLTCLANDYLRGIGDYEDIQALFNSPTLTEVRVADLIEDVRNKWQVAIYASDAASNVSLSVDLLLFDIAIGNLIENARKFGRTAENIGLAFHADAGHVSFDVKDDGPGIPSAEAEKVFRQFYKINSTQTNAIKGCGLGLYIVRRIAEAHGGTCKVLSQRPSTLRLTLPKPGPRGKTA
jgi:signal transduction histidine kinase